MNYYVSILFNDRLFSLTLSEGESAEISASAQANITIPNFAHVIKINESRGAIYVCDTGKNRNKNVLLFAMRLNYPYTLDKTHHIAICASKEMFCETTALLGENFSISLGRKAEGKDGRKNDIVLSSLPFVSRRHFEIVRKSGKTMLRDLDSTNGTFVNGRKIKEVELHPDDVISILTARILYMGDCLQFENIAGEPSLADDLNKAPSAVKSNTEQFKRSPRIKERLPEGKIEIPAPPAEESKPEINWLSTLLPAGVTIAVAVTMAVAFQNTMTMLYSLPMTIAGVVVSIVNFLRGKKNYKKNLKERSTVYFKKLEEVEDNIRKKRDAQMRAMLLSDPAPNDCFETVKFRSTALWCRKPTDSDFMSVRIGTGEVPFSVKLEGLREQMMEEDELKKKAGELYRANCTIQNMPILCDIRGSGVIGILGTRQTTYAQLQNMLLHLATHHCYTELKIVCFCSENDRDELSWLEDLPHTRGDSRDEVYFASTQEEADSLLRSFTEMFKQRKQEVSENSSYGSAPLFLPYVLFAFFEPKLLKKAHPINQYLFLEHGLGAGCLMAAQNIAELPQQCTQIIDLSDDGGEMYNTARASERQSFLADKVSSNARKLFGRSMRPLYCDESFDSGGALPKSYSFYQMLGVRTMSEFDIGRSWRNSDLLTSERAPSAPIGVLEDGNQMFFNSPPSGEYGGAHGLVAGTTGSGKSETLLTLILSLALRYPPEEAGFLVIDFKGDSIASRLEGLPHLRGVITSLDGDELRRSLISIRAEINNRAAMFKEYNNSHPKEKKKITDIIGYAERYKQGMVEQPLPHLFIVVDEFAEMKKQLPDVMDQFLSVAQVGRSLGVHLILATQSPSGVVDSKILANINKELCLKVANSGESRDVIGKDLAAHIKYPGRAYLKAGDDLRHFQSAYGGGKLMLPDGTESTQIGEAVEAIANYCRAHGIQKLPDIFSPPLPHRADYPKLPQNGTRAQDFGMLPIGIRDDPEKQFMGSFSLDVFSNNTLIVGSQQTGKTNLLQAILRGAAEMYSPEEVNIYILEFAALFLKNYEALPHVGGVATLQETEKITNLFRLLHEQIELRKKKFLKLGVSSFAAYRESGRRDLPQILLLVDNLAAAKEYFPLDSDPLLRVCKEGLSVGISVVATATQAVGSSTYLPTFAIANRIALFNNDPMVYANLLGHTAIRPKNLPGRCLVTYGENKIYACQSFLAFEGRMEIDRTKAVRSFCEEQTAKAGGKRAAPIPYIPEEFSADDAFAAYPDEYSGDRLMLGLNYSTVKPLSVRLAALGMLAISGREDAVSNFQRYLLTAAGKASGPRTEFYIVDGISRTLQPLSKLPCVAEYSFLPEQATQMLLTVRKKAEERYSRVAGGDADFLDKSPTMVLMLNSSEAIDAISKDKAALESWLMLIGKLKAMKVCTVFGALDNASIPFGAEVLKKFKDNRRLVFFDELNNLKIGDLPYATIKKFSGGRKKGDGYLIIGDDAARIRVPDCLRPESK